MLYSQLDEKNENFKFMGKKIDLLINYPKPKRNLDKRASKKSKDDISIARKFGKEFFDGDRKHGYGGYNYHPRFWQPVIPTFKEHFNLDSSSSLLDVGCAKGFMLYDLIQIIPGITVSGVDISEYAIKNTIDSISQKIINAIIFKTTIFFPFIR